VGDASARDVAWPEFVRLWSRLIEESSSPGTVILVEGERDRASLHKLLIEGEIVLLHHGRPLSAVAQELLGSARRVILLTDWDTEGGHLAQRVREFLEGSRVELDVEYRRKLARVLRGELVHVEGLAGWARRTAERAGTSLEGALSGVEGTGRPPRSTG
jgi:5S rRNA maturation endonuclease (ribonuclease M5)